MLNKKNKQKNYISKQKIKFTKGFMELFEK